MVLDGEITMKRERVY